MPELKEKTDKTREAMRLTEEFEVHLGGVITLRIMGLGEINHMAAEFMQFIEAFASRFENPDAPISTGGIEIAERIIEMSLLRPEDSARVTAPDLEPILTRIWEINRLSALVNFMLGRRMEVLRAYVQNSPTAPTQTQKPD